jgi:hypothetical protein
MVAPGLLTRIRRLLSLARNGCLCVWLCARAASGMRINRLWSKQRQEEASKLRGSTRVQRGEEQWVTVVDDLWNHLRSGGPSHLISMAVRGVCP